MIWLLQRGGLKKQVERLTIRTGWLAVLSMACWLGQGGASPLSSMALAEEIRPAAKIAPVTDAWREVVRQNAPGPIAETEKKSEKQVQPEPPCRKILVFSHLTGYVHEVVPHVDAVFEILGKKTGLFKTVVSRDIEQLSPERLAEFDAIVLNNNCSKGPRRNLFLDELETNPKYQDLTENQRKVKAAMLERSLLDFVQGGKGLVAIHGAPTMLNNSPEFTEMVGGAFEYHPPTQRVILNLVEPAHRLVTAFRGKMPFIHTDEPYCFCGTYARKNFRPLLVMDASKLNDQKKKAATDIRYVAWVKRYGEGRVFYCSPSHYPESYESATLLQFLLDGTRYALGDLKCEDSVPAKEDR